MIGYKLSPHAYAKQIQKAKDSPGTVLLERQRSSNTAYTDLETSHPGLQQKDWQVRTFRGVGTEGRHPDAQRAIQTTTGSWEYARK